MHKRLRGIGILLAWVFSAFASPPVESCITAEEAELASLLNAYRAEHKLQPIALSPDLMVVAQTHARDLAANHPDHDSCTAHSWSAAGPWTACCYTPDHRLARCMWDKPKELTGYKGTGFEIASTGSIGASPGLHLDGWKSSAVHNDVILNFNQWRKVGWTALGVGIHGGYAVVWFGAIKDPKAALPPCPNSH